MLIIGSQIHEGAKSCGTISSHRNSPEKPIASLKERYTFHTAKPGRSHSLVSKIIFKICA